MYKKQIVVVLAVVATMGYLYTQPVKGLIKPKATRQNAGVAAQGANPGTAFTEETASSAAKATIGAGLSAKISDLETQLKNATDEATRLGLQKQLAKQWDDVNQPAPAALYYQAVAHKENTFENWLAAGNHFNDAFKVSQDTTAQPVFITGSVEAFQNALKFKPASLDAKTGLGIAYVNGGGAPMQGITLLLDVVKQDPANHNANLNLGLFAMKSGQFDKAVTRFKGMIARKEEVEPYFYLAESYKQLGMKKEAIAAYQKCREMMPDVTFDQRIDQYIKELQN